MMKQIVSPFFVMVLFTIFFYSCKKEEKNSSTCSAGCTTIHLSGKLVDVFSNEGIRNTEVKAHFYQWKRSCFYCFDKPFENFAKTKTDDLGRFNIDISVDTDVFNISYNYTLDVYTNTNDNYILGRSISFSDYRENFTNINLTTYKKTKLRITFKRDSADIFSVYLATNVFYDNINGKYIEPTNQSTIFFKLYAPIIADSTVEVYTGANFYAKINGRKSSGNPTSTLYTDSVFCNANVTNNITIKY